MVWPAALLSKLFRVRIGRDACEVRWLQLDRERGEVEPTPLEEHAGLPAALLGAEQQEGALGIVGRSGADWARLRLGPQLLGLGPDAVGERRGAGMLLRDAGGKRDDGADGTGRDDQFWFRFLDKT